VLLVLGSTLAALILGPAASAHSNPCHGSHSCPSDHHSYAWTDAGGRTWDCARTGADEYEPARDRETIVYDGHTYHCFPVGSSGSGTAPRGFAGTVTSAVISHVVDGDTVDLTNGRRVRLVQIDTPEVYNGLECYGAQASAATKRLLPVGTRVKLLPDPAADPTDRYGRLLRYVVRVADGVNVNLRLVSEGDAAPYFYDGQRGRFAAQLERLAQRARAGRRGLWGRCPGTPYSPYTSVDSRR
jgi:micrococcal nuclease